MLGGTHFRAKDGGCSLVGWGHAPALCCRDPGSPILETAAADLLPTPCRGSSQPRLGPWGAAAAGLAPVFMHPSL